MPMSAAMHTDLAECQQAAQALADRVKWWTDRDGVWSHKDCSTLSRTNPGYCDLVLTDGSMIKGMTNCHGTGKVLRYPHLFTAIFNTDYWTADKGYQAEVRPVKDICWRLQGAMKADGMFLSVDSGHVVVVIGTETAHVPVGNEHECIATFAALTRVLVKANVV